MRAKKRPEKIGVCPHCGAPIYNGNEDPSTLPRAAYSCDCRDKVIYQSHETTIIVQPPAVHPPAVPDIGWGTGDPLPHLPRVIC